MKIEITKTPEITYSKIIYVFKAKVEGVEYKIGRHEDDNGAKLFIEPQPETEKVYYAIEELFFHDHFHYNTTQEGDVLEVEN